MTQGYENYESYFRGSDAAIEGRREELALLVESVISQRGSPPLTWLDIGAGTGALLNLVSDKGIATTAIERDTELAIQCENNGHVTYKSEQSIAIEEIVASGQKFDIISALHVIEHLDTDEAWNLVQGCNSLLVEGGDLIIETPNVSDPRVMLGSFYRDPTHKRPFPALLLEYLVQDNHFELISRDTFDKSVGVPTDNDSMAQKVANLRKTAKAITVKIQKLS